ncbi:Aste57867_10137 [Aphanomyces stellatus]|uniref:Aste57867_10137 protein n=1 Tax=Aphanomyces stellatus TaxID=120398 RepID=A0A485KQ19_9STRA|nr:hypothetical protein As57867_010098 [Aphanomyces stellatus]VFT87013.1 Aste57867_10137 [Aphanomyces stellatus]
MNSTEPGAPPPPPLGLTLAFFHEFVRRCNDPLDGLTTTQVCKQYVVPYTRSTESSVVDHVRATDPDEARFVRPAMWYVSHAWGYLFLETLDALDAFVAQRGLAADDVSFWFCVFNVNQHSDHTDDLDTVFRTSLLAIQRVVMIVHPWNDPLTLTRLWCVYEVYLASVLALDAVDAVAADDDEHAETHLRFDVAMSHAQKKAFLADMRVHANAFVDMLGRVKTARALTTRTRDRTRLTALVHAAVGTFAALDQIMFRVLFKWMLRCVQGQAMAAQDACARATWSHVVGVLLCDDDQDAAAHSWLQHAFESFQAQGETAAACRSLLYLCRIRAAGGGDAWEQPLRQCLAWQSATLGAAHADTLDTMYELAYCYADVEEYGAAIALLEICVAARRQDEAFVMEATLASSLLGHIFVQTQAWEMAVQWLEPCLAAQTAHLGLDHPATGRTANNLAVAYVHRGEPARALQLYEDAHATNLRVHGAEHEATRTSSRNIDETRRLLEGSPALD